MSESEIVKKLLNGDEEFKSMYFEHRKLDDMVKDMEKKGSSISHNEELEIKRLKKMKLALKDKMEERIRKERGNS